MLAVLLEQDHRQQVGARPATRCRVERRRRLADLLATPAGGAGECWLADGEPVGGGDELAGLRNRDELVQIAAFFEQGAAPRLRVQGDRDPGPCQRPAGEGGIGESRGRLRGGLRDRQTRRADAGRGGEGAPARRHAGAGDRSGPRGRGDRLAGSDLAPAARRGRRCAGAPRRLPRGDAGGGARRPGPAARARHGPGAGVAGAPGARLPGGLRACPRYSGASCRAVARRAGCSRWRCASCASARRRSRLSRRAPGGRSRRRPR